MHGAPAGSPRRPRTRSAGSTRRRPPSRRPAARSCSTRSAPAGRSPRRAGPRAARRAAGHHGHARRALRLRPDRRGRRLAVIAQFARVAAERPPGAQRSDDRATPGAANAIIVNPQGTRVLYGQTGNIVARAINADGTLGRRPRRRSPRRRAGRRAVAGDDRRRAQPLRERHERRERADLAVRRRPASGAIGRRDRRSQLAGPAGGPTVGAGRWRSRRRAATSTSRPTRRGPGIGHWAIDPATGALTGGSVQAPPPDTYAEAAVATSLAGDALWAPSASGTSAAPERIRQFAIGAAGALDPARAARCQLRRRRARRATSSPAPTA